MYQQFDYLAPLVQSKHIANADGTGNIYLPQVSGRALRYDVILVTSDDSAARVMQLHVISGGVDSIVGSVSIPAGSGYAGAANVDLVSALLPAGVPYILLDSGAQLALSMEAAVTAGKTVGVAALGGQF